MGVIYLIENTKNGKKYVGLTKGKAEDRFQRHVSSARRKSPFRLHAAMRKHGVESFTITVLEENISSKTLAQLEQKWIAHYNSRDYTHGYNMTMGGEGALARGVSQETRDRIGQASKKRWAAMTVEERRAAMVVTNTAKRGMVESDKSRHLKSQAQKTRFGAMSDEELTLHGMRCRNGISEEGQRRQTVAMIAAMSPRRQKGYKDPLAECPHCKKIGGQAAMKRYHFDRCKFNEHLSSSPQSD